MTHILIIFREVVFILDVGQSCFHGAN